MVAHICVGQDWPSYRKRFAGRDHSNPPTIALSRAKRKIFLMASRSIFQLFLTNEEQFANLQLWKNLLLRAWEDAGPARDLSGHYNPRRWAFFSS